MREMQKIVEPAILPSAQYGPVGANSGNAQAPAERVLNREIANVNLAQLESTVWAHLRILDLVIHTNVQFGQRGVGMNHVQNHAGPVTN